jgi:hypothetical protein
MVSPSYKWHIGDGQAVLASPLMMKAPAKDSRESEKPF